MKTALSYINSQSQYALIKEIYAIIEAHVKERHGRVHRTLQSINELFDGAMEKSAFSYIVSESRYVLLNSISRMINASLKEMSAIHTGTIEESTQPYTYFSKKNAHEVWMINGILESTN